MSKWDMVRDSFERAHADLFDSRYEVTFYNYSAGDYNPDTGQLENETKSSIGSATVEIVPPAQDTTIDLQGTDVDWTTSIRFPIDSTELTVASGETYVVPDGTTEIYTSVTVESNATLEVNGAVITKSLTDNGLVTGDGQVSVLGGSGTNPFVSNINTLGVDNEKPTEVEITDQKDGTKETFELHSYTTEIGSGMIMCRLVD